MKRKQQQQIVDDLLISVKQDSARAVAARRSLTERKNAIIGRPTVMIWAFAIGAFMASGKSKSKKVAINKRAVSTLSLINTGLAGWALLKRVDILNQSNSHLDEVQEET